MSRVFSTVNPVERMMRFRVGTLRLGVVAIAALPCAAMAQGVVEPHLAISAGNATDALGARSGAMTVAPGLTLRPSSEVTVGLGVDGTRFTNEQWSAGGSASLGVRAPLSRLLAFTLGANAAVTQTAHDARYTSGELLPALEATTGPLALFAGARGARGGVRIAQPGVGGALPIGERAPASTYTSSATLRSVVYGGVARRDGDRVPGSLAYREERGAVGDSAFVDRTVSATLQQGRLQLSGAVGTRVLADEREGYGSVVATLAVRSGVALQAAGGRYAANPLTSAVGGTYLSVGVVLSRGGRAGSPEAPRPVQLRGEPRPAPGMTRLAIRAPGARRVELAGDWSSWTLVPARRAADGAHWYVDVRLAPGRYRYAFRVDGTRWSVPEGTKAVDDGFGGKSAWLTIE